MCNAWNHDPGCRCGFGGETHSGSTILRERGELTSYESYLNPFAKCPACGAAVFFFQAPNSGRVFFDELGPPWPKHPCTDRSMDHQTVEIDRRIRASDAAPATWQKEGWSPFLLEEMDLPPRQRNYLVYGRIITANGAHTTSICMDKEFVAQVSEWGNRWQPTAPTFYRLIGDTGNCELSGVILRGNKVKEYNFKGWRRW